MNIQNNWFIGVVEAENDPEKMGRVKVRCFGYHTQDKTELPDADLPWTQCIFPVDNGPASGGRGASPALQKDSIVFGAFYDGDNLQDAIILGTVPVGVFVREESPEPFSLGRGRGIPDTGAPPNEIFEEGQIGTERPQSANDDPPPPPTTVQPGAGNAIAAAAELQVKSGEPEIRETSKNQGPGIEKFWEATSAGTNGYANREPWCAAFACWVVRQSGTLPKDKLPTSAGSSGWLVWAEKNSDIVEKMKFSAAASEGLQRGDIIIRTPLKSDKDRPGGHVSIVKSIREDGSFQTIDGNYSDRVAIARRNRSGMDEARYYVLRIKETGQKPNQNVPVD